jgi:hypothetical protein
VSDDDEFEVLVHKELLCFFSSYYTAALKSNFSEAQKTRFDVALSGESLKFFITWLYTGSIPDNFYIVDRCLDLYAFADLVDIVALRRKALTKLSETEHLVPCYESIRLVLGHITQHSQLYKWLKDFYIAHWEPAHDDNDPCLFDNETDPDHLLAIFMYKVMRGLADRKERDPDNCSCCSNICQYHEHESKEEWKASMLT